MDKLRKMAIKNAQDLIDQADRCKMAAQRIIDMYNLNRGEVYKRSPIEEKYGRVNSK